VFIDDATSSLMELLFTGHYFEAPRRHLQRFGSRRPSTATRRRCSDPRRRLRHWSRGLNWIVVSELQPRRVVAVSARQALP
jgi:hypothetical protein